MDFTVLLLLLLLDMDNQDFEYCSDDGFDNFLDQYSSSIWIFIV